MSERRYAKAWMTRRRWIGNYCSLSLAVQELLHQPTRQQVHGPKGDISSTRHEELLVPWNCRCGSFHGFQNWLEKVMRRKRNREIFIKYRDMVIHLSHRVGLTWFSCSCALMLCSPRGDYEISCSSPLSTDYFDSDWFLSSKTFPRFK